MTRHYIVGIDLADVAEHIGRRCIIVLPQNSFLNKEARETIQFFLKASVLLR